MMQPEKPNMYVSNRRAGLRTATRASLANSPSVARRPARPSTTACSVMPVPPHPSPCSAGLVAVAHHELDPAQIAGTQAILERDTEAHVSLLPAPGTPEVLDFVRRGRRTVSRRASTRAADPRSPGPRWVLVRHGPAPNAATSRRSSTTSSRPSRCRQPGLNAPRGRPCATFHVRRPVPCKCSLSQLS